MTGDGKTTIRKAVSSIEDRFSDYIRGKIVFSPSPPDVVSPEGILSNSVVRALKLQGIERLYLHQVDAFKNVMEGKSIVVSTPSASGKSMCYLLPIAEFSIRGKKSNALVLFPTKALSRDQQMRMEEFFKSAGVGHNVVTYDGDTPVSQRKMMRSGASILITNPDMLHAGILPRHPVWADFFSSVSFVVVDELHSYRGVFGSHVANVMRRLERVLNFYGVRPRWISLSATIGNPCELAESITGHRPVLIDKGGAPSGRKIFYLMSCRRNQPYVSDCGDVFVRVVGDVAVVLASAGLHTIVFANTRCAVEILLKYIKRSFEREGFDGEVVEGYRGGYLPSQRREIEQKLRGGVLKCVIATSALELGIDIGSLDSVVMAGYPGTISALYQRLGRAGRKGGEALAVLIGGFSPIDQFIVHNSEYVTGSTPECGYVNPDNIEILIPHLRCAVSEMMFSKGERFSALEVDEMEEVWNFLASRKEVSVSGNRIYWIGEAAPASRISLRTADSDRFSIVDVSDGKVVEEMEKTRVLRSLHPGAIIHHAARQFEVAEIDWEGMQVKVVEVDKPYYTQPVWEDRVEVVEEYDLRRLNGGTVCCGEIRIIQRGSAYRCIRYLTNEVIGINATELASSSIVVDAVWIEFNDRTIERLSSVDSRNGTDWRSRLFDGLDGMGYTMQKMGSLLLMCDPRDLDYCVSINMSPFLRGESVLPETKLFIFELYPGGVGIVRGYYERFDEIADGSLNVIKSCPCRGGCPSCVGPSGGRRMKKRSSIILLTGVINM